MTKGMKTSTVGKEIELLEHHADLLADQLDRLHSIGELRAVDDDAALLVQLDTQ
jgi:hypothetical protein